jgi:uncharacterized protein (DUF1697 family)
VPSVVVLLRGVNLGSRNRIAMPALREALADAGFADVRTYVQSGNVVVSSRAKPERVARDVERLIAKRFDLDVAVVARSRNELAAVVERNPLRRVATNPKRYQVTFLAAPLGHDVVQKLEAAAAPGERVVVDGREVYAWHPEGVARSKLWAALAGTGLGTLGTSRNWTTVESLLELADS